MNKAELIEALKPFPDDFSIIVSTYDDIIELTEVFSLNDGVIYLRAQV